MAIKEFKKLNSLPLELQKVQHNVWMHFNEINKSLKDQTATTDQSITDLTAQIDAINALPFLNGVFITFVTGVAAGTVAVAHTLGKIPTGYIITDYVNPSGAPDSIGRVSWNASTITFGFSGMATTSTFKIWVF